MWILMSRLMAMMKNIDGQDDVEDQNDSESVDSSHQIATALISGKKNERNERLEKPQQVTRGAGIIGFQISDLRWHQTDTQ
jgi:hypothetical protein